MIQSILFATIVIINKVSNMTAIVKSIEKVGDSMSLMQFGTTMLAGAVTFSAAGYFIGTPIMQMILG